MNNKICKNCNINKNINDYNELISESDGYQNICKKCHTKEKS
jgi:hypothetical protein